MIKSLTVFKDKLSQYLFKLEKIVAGYTGLARSLNDQLMQELMTKDELLAKQDMMLDTISEMTDNLF